MIGRQSASMSSRLPRRIDEDVVEVVRDAARERAERIELLRLAHALFQPPALRDVADDAEQANRLAFFVVHVAAGPGDPALRADRTHG